MNLDLTFDYEFYSQKYHCLTFNHYQNPLICKLITISIIFYGSVSIDQYNKKRHMLLVWIEKGGQNNLVIHFQVPSRIKNYGSTKCSISLPVWHLRYRTGAITKRIQKNWGNFYIFTMSTFLLVCLSFNGTVSNDSTDTGKGSK